MKISDVGARGTIDYRSDRHELFRPRSTDMVSIYFKGVCRGNDFSRARLKEGRFLTGKAGNYGVEKNRNGMDNKISSNPLKQWRYSRD